MLKYIKSIVIDRKNINGYLTGKADDEIVFDKDYIFTSVSLYKKSEQDYVKEGLCGDTTHNKVMVLKYKNKNNVEE